LHRHGCGIALITCQQQKGLDQFAHFFTGPGDTLYLRAPTGVQRRVFLQQLA
jgi:hypothetical protein